ncbi:hypothetical protein MASR1M90_00220 [Desulfovibrionales bacterium]
MAKNNTTPSITLDDKTYPVDTLSDEAKAQVNNLHIVDAEIARLQNMIRIAQTARMTYYHALKAELAKLD